MFNNTDFINKKPTAQALPEFLLQLTPGVRCRADTDTGTDLVNVMSIEGGNVTSFQTLVTVQAEDGERAPYEIAAGSLLRVVHLKAHLVCEIELDAGLETAKDFQEGLEQRFATAIGNGLLTGDSTAVVNEHTYRVRAVPADDAGPSQGDIEDYFRDRIENGNLSAEDIPRLLARLALADPQAMRDEYRERIEELQSDEVDA